MSSHPSFRSVLLLCLCLVFMHTRSSAQGTWVPITDSAPAACGGQMLLMSDGTVMAKSSVWNLWMRLKPDIHGSYIHGTWSLTDTMFSSRLAFSSCVLRNGHLYAAGGEYGTGKATVETFDPITGHWTNAPAMSGGDYISDAPSSLLSNGNVLQGFFPASGSSDCKIFVPSANIYFPGPATLGDFDESTWLKLPDNSILFADREHRASERYIPALNTWVADDTLPVSVYDTWDGETGPAFLLPDGRAFFTGSPGTTAYYTPSGTASPGSWAAGPIFPGSQGVPDAAGAMMVNGKILIAVSFVPYGPLVYPSPTAFFEFNYLLDSFTLVTAPTGAPNMAIPCYYTNMLDLPDGSVLFAANGFTHYYEYVPDGSPLAAGKPVINNIFKIACDTYMITGTGFNGITEGASYGDDEQMASNYPLVRLSASGNMYYAFSYNWNTAGVMRGALPDTAFFVLPVALPEGTYDLAVVANGNPSDPHSFSTCMPSLSSSSVAFENDNSFYAYPNPSTGQTTIVFDSRDDGKYGLKVIDVTGRTIRYETGIATTGENKCQLDLSAMPKGLYTVILIKEDDVRKIQLAVE